MANSTELPSPGKASDDPDADTLTVANCELLDVFEKSIVDLQASLSSGCFTSAALVRAYLQRIEAYDQQGPSINAIVALSPCALEQAVSLDIERSQTGPRGLLHGIPVLVKDNFDVAGMATSGGALALATLRPQNDAFQVVRLKRAGAIILGKTTMHELAAGITNISSLTGATRNPYSPLRNPGGSSGGTAAAVAASFATAGLGSDTSGSIRIPAANQNLFGLRPTFGLSSRQGIMPLSPSQDIGGPLARTVRDLAIMLDATMGEDAQDPTTCGAKAHIPDSYFAGLRINSLSEARIGVLSGFFGSGMDEVEVSAIVREAILGMRDMGAEIIEVDILDIEALMQESNTIKHEFKFALSDYLAGYDNPPVRSLSEIISRRLHHELLDPVFRLRDMPKHRDTPDYRAAKKKRVVLSLLMQEAMNKFHLTALAYPVLRGKPALIGELQPGENCQLSPSTGLPAIAIPAGFTQDGVPVGLELLATAYSEQMLLNYALDWEQSGPRRVPAPHTPALSNGHAPKRLSGFVHLSPDFTQTCLAKISYVFDITTGDVWFDVEVEIVGGGSDSVIALTLQSSENGRPGPIIFHLLRTGHLCGHSKTSLQARHLSDALLGRLYFHLYTRAAPLGAVRICFNPAHAFDGIALSRKVS